MWYNVLGTCDLRSAVIFIKVRLRYAVLLQTPVPSSYNFLKCFERPSKNLRKPSKYHKNASAHINFKAFKRLQNTTKTQVSMPTCGPAYCNTIYVSAARGPAVPKSTCVKVPHPVPQVPSSGGNCTAGIAAAGLASAGTAGGGTASTARPRQGSCSASPLLLFGII